VVAPAAGTVVLVPFPFSDLSKSKLRPAVVLADAGRGDWILCQITSNPYGDSHALPLSDEGFDEGGLERVSYVRPGKLFTANADLILRRAGTLRRESFKQIVDAVVALLQSGLNKE